MRAYLQRGFGGGAHCAGGRLQRGAVSAAIHRSAYVGESVGACALQVNGCLWYIGTEIVKRSHRVGSRLVIEIGPLGQVFISGHIGIDIRAVTSAIHVVNHAAADIHIGLLAHVPRDIVAAIHIVHYSALYHHVSGKNVGHAGTAIHGPRYFAAFHGHVGLKLKVTLISAAVHVPANANHRLWRLSH